MALTPDLPVWRLDLVTAAERARLAWLLAPVGPGVAARVRARAWFASVVELLAVAGCRGAGRCGRGGRGRGATELSGFVVARRGSGAAVAGAGRGRGKPGRTVPGARGRRGGRRWWRRGGRGALSWRSIRPIRTRGCAT